MRGVTGANLKLKEFLLKWHTSWCTVPYKIFLALVIYFLWHLRSRAWYSAAHPAVRETPCITCAPHEPQATPRRLWPAAQRTKVFAKRGEYAAPRLARGYVEGQLGRGRARVLSGWQGRRAVLLRKLVSSRSASCVSAREHGPLSSRPTSSPGLSHSDLEPSRHIVSGDGCTAVTTTKYMYPSSHTWFDVMA